MAGRPARRLPQQRRSRAHGWAGFASTTATFADRSNAGLVATALGLPSTASRSIADRPAGGSDALIAALEGRTRRKTGSVIAADRRLARPGSPQEAGHGPGAAAARWSGPRLIADDSRMSRWAATSSIIIASRRGLRLRARGTLGSGRGLSRVAADGDPAALERAGVAPATSRISSLPPRRASRNRSLAPGVPGGGVVADRSTTAAISASRMRCCCLRSARTRGAR